MINIKQKKLQKSDNKYLKKMPFLYATQPLKNEQGNLKIHKYISR